MLCLAIQNQPFRKYLTRISLSFVLKSSSPGDGKTCRFPEGETRDREREHNSPHSFWNSKTERYVCQTRRLGSSEEAKHPPEEALHFLHRG